MFELVYPFRTKSAADLPITGPKRIPFLPAPLAITIFGFPGKNPKTGSPSGLRGRKQAVCFIISPWAN